MCFLLALVIRQQATNNTHSNTPTMFATLGKIFRFVIIGSCAVALIFQFINTASCTFVYKSSEGADNGSAGGTIDFGLYRMGINSECVEGKYDALHEEDKLLEAARACHLTSMIAGAIGMLFVLVECVKCAIPCGGLVEGLAFFIAWTNGLSVFAVFGMEGCGNYLHLEALQNQLDSLASVAELIDSMDANPQSEFMNPQMITDLENNSMNDNNMTSVADLLDGMDANPQLSEFTLNPQMKEQITTLNSMNVTELVPDFVELVPFGTKCEWGEGASLNLMAALLYLGCGILLCVTPRPVHSSSNNDNDTDNDRSLGGSRTNLSRNFDNEDLRLATTTDDAKIV